MASRKRTRARKGLANRFRINAGRWRGRRFDFPAQDDLRPTPDRVRETLFNWLAPAMPGSACLDLCAGSGALGLEALSRGAASVVFVEDNDEACRKISGHLDALECSDGEVLCLDARRYLAGSARQFDHVFVDPPYASGILGELCTLLLKGGWLSQKARVYVEYPAGERPDIDSGLVTLRQARAGRVEYELLSLRQSP